MIEGMNVLNCINKISLSENQLYLYSIEFGGNKSLNNMHCIYCDEWGDWQCDCDCDCLYSPCNCDD